MEEFVYLNLLYEQYKNLFNEKKQNIFDAYYINNFSLFEISENENITRSAVSKILKGIKEELLNYEECLKLHEKSEKFNEIINKIEDTYLKEKLLDLDI